MLDSETWDWETQMRKVAARFQGTRGVFLQFGDSLTASAPSQGWAHDGIGHTAEERVFLRWTHVNTKGGLDGWYLAKTLRGAEQPQKISYTAGIGCCARYLLTGRRGLEPLTELITRYNPQLAAYAIGVSDMLRGTLLDEFCTDVETALNLLLANGTVPILFTIPPCRDHQARVQETNVALISLGAKLQIPILDLYQEMARRNANVLEYLAEDGYHLTADFPRGPATAAHLKTCGYLLRCYLTVHKGIQVKARVLDPTWRNRRFDPRVLSQRHAIYEHARIYPRRIGRAFSALARITRRFVR